MELLHQPGDTIAQRYRILNILGQGGVGTTYEAQDLKNDQIVALKALSLRRMADWKMMELFEREARILSQLNHPAIPRYLDYFQVDTDQDRSFYIAQQLAPGKSLAVLVESGWHPNKSEVRHLATQVLEILAYLQEFTPPIIHRDIKPQNIIRREDGQVFLVDFGAVQDTYHNTVTGGSTVVGTYGYMAPEQFRGQAVLSTDLYGLGTTLLFLLTCKSPSELPQRKLKINFRSHVHLDKEFADWLEKMLEPVIEDRFQSAKEALAVLRGEQILTSYCSQKLRPPKDSPITFIKADGRLVVEIPPLLMHTPHSQIFGLLCLVWNGLSFLAWWVIIQSRYPIGAYSPSTEGFLVVFTIIGFILLLGFITWISPRIQLEITRTNFQLRGLADSFSWHTVKGETTDIHQVKLSYIGLPLKNNPFSFCVIQARRHKYWFGLFMTPTEKERLVDEITAFLKEMREG